MIVVFYAENGVIKEDIMGKDDPCPSHPLWIDVIQPTQEEQYELEVKTGISIPSQSQIAQNQILNRLYEKDGVLFMTLAIITKTLAPYPDVRTVTFILTKQFLITIRDIFPTSFQNFSKRIVNEHKKFCDSMDVFQGLLEEISIRLAYNSELVSNELDELSHDIFGRNFTGETLKQPTTFMKSVLMKLGKNADLNSKVHESAQSLHHMMAFIKESEFLNEKNKMHVETIIEDIHSIIRQTGFISEKLNFQLDASLGMINVEQNTIMKVFSVVTLFFVPPTLVSSIYGMNFKEMPELSWDNGYPMALFLMVVLAIGPFIYFRKKRWL